MTNRAMTPRSLGLAFLDDWDIGWGIGDLPLKEAAAARRGHIYRYGTNRPCLVTGM